MTYTPTEGTVIYGTTQLIHIVPALYDELKRFDADAFIFLLDAIADDVAFARSIRDDGAGDDIEWLEGVGGSMPENDVGFWIYERLFAALEASAPPGLYFGAHEGASTDIGWWPVDDLADPPEHGSSIDPGDPA